MDRRVITVLVGGTACTCLQAAASRGQITLPGTSFLPISAAIVWPYLVIPSALALLIGENPVRYALPPAGSRGGRLGVLLLLLVVAGAGLVAATGGRGGIELVLTLFCVEFFFRGFVLMPLLARLGEHAVFIVTWPYALAHVGKPAWELFGSILLGLGLASLAARTRTIVYGFGIHVALAMAGLMALSR